MWIVRNSFQIAKIYNVAGGVKKGHNLKQNLMKRIFKYNKETLVQIDEIVNGWGLKNVKYGAKWW